VSLPGRIAPILRKAKFLKLDTQISSVLRGLSVSKPA
jgi:hypothetical protein